jgi:SAM-dependent methyltransferase
MVDRLFSEKSLAALYDVMHPPGQRADFAFYLPLIMSAPAALDVGCGTGALLREARARGHRGRLCGLDPAEGMLAQARQRADIEWILGDLASLARTGEFDLIVMTGHAFQVLIEDDEVRASLAAVRSALTRQGRFAFETRNPLARAWESWTTKEPEEIADGPAAGTRAACKVTAPFDGRTVSFTYTFTHPGWSRPEISHSTLRFLDAPTLLSFLGEAGLAIEAQFGDWDRRPLTESSPEIITIARPS